MQGGWHQQPSECASSGALHDTFAVNEPLALVMRQANFGVIKHLQSTACSQLRIRGTA